jgi:hypothetical protein
MDLATMLIKNLLDNVAIDLIHLLFVQEFWFAKLFENYLYA